MTNSHKKPKKPAAPAAAALRGLLRPQTFRVAPVRLCDFIAVRRLGSATTKRSGDSHEIEPVILVGY
jgi:hypothetical protein